MISSNPKFNFMLILPFSASDYSIPEIYEMKHVVRKYETNVRVENRQIKNRNLINRPFFLCFRAAENHFLQSSPSTRYFPNILTYNIDSFISATLTINFETFIFCCYAKFEKFVLPEICSENRRYIENREHWDIE